MIGTTLTYLIVLYQFQSSETNIQGKVPRILRMIKFAAKCLQEVEHITLIFVERSRRRLNDLNIRCTLPYLNDLPIHKLKRTDVIEAFNKLQQSGNV